MGAELSCCSATTGASSDSTDPVSVYVSGRASPDDRQVEAGHKIVFWPNQRQQQHDGDEDDDDGHSVEETAELQRTTTVSPTLGGIKCIGLLATSEQPR
jgi:hypothetical protein